MKNQQLILKKDKILDFFYPPHCPVCGRRVYGKADASEGLLAGLICPECLMRLPVIGADYCMKCGKPLSDARREYCDDCRKRRHFFDQGRSLFSYQGKIRESLYRLKYSNRREYARFYAAFSAEMLGGWIRQRRITSIVPVPLHPERQRKRGYNQASEIACRLGAWMDIPVHEEWLCRVKHTVPQKNLTQAQRQKNLSGAFRCIYRIPPGESILLTDDIYTTGSTADAASEALRAAGGSRIYLLTAAIGG